MILMAFYLKRKYLQSPIISNKQSPIISNKQNGFIASNDWCNAA